MTPLTPAELLNDPWAYGPWCWVVDEVRLLPEPLPCRGMQGLWPVTAPVVHALDAMVSGARWSALTLLQPYASAVASGSKRVENRPWRRALPPNGRWVGLHAGKALLPTDPDEVEREYLAPWREGGQWPRAPRVSELPRGVMLGAMHIAQILRYPELP